jgi:hypothetical protein
MDVDTADDAFDLMILHLCKQVNRQKRRLKVRKVREHPGPADMEFDHMQVWITNTPFSYHLTILDFTTDVL